MRKKTKKIAIIAYVIIIFIFVILSWDFYLGKKNYVTSSDEFLKNPPKYAGQYTEFAGTILNVSGQSFYMLVNQKPLKVYYNGLEKPVLGQTYARLRLNSDGTAAASEVHNLSYNYLKYVISFFAFFLFLFIFFREWKFKKWRFAENA
mgnify:CR=1 FL=1